MNDRNARATRALSTERGKDVEAHYWLARLARLEERLSQEIDDISSRQPPGPSVVDSPASYNVGRMAGLMRARDDLRSLRRDLAAQGARSR